ncbi:hypothetical protein CDD80_5604 [Ophiocordyceps camponoti-rufipedis]|uniref:Uncharacterized protein n=1 Tax=Ophiocordyceps camponoti-rufipedis TaxID=2004952 RepID=A0A2C5YUJ7_9HYPO|nr:hypothetical protein CDD80_5604 [Ophiocordyceps camponoti-rufipedis]
MDSLARRTFVCWEAANIAKDAGFALAIQVKKPNKDNPTSSTDTQMTACPFRVDLWFDKDRDVWTVKPVRSGHHPRPLSQISDVSGSSGFSRLHEAELRRCTSKIAGSAPKPGTRVAYFVPPRA